MKFKRKIHERFEKWFKSENKVPLLVKGARQVGKTTTIKDFIKKHYENMVYIDFRHDEEYLKAFDGNLRVDQIINELKVINLDEEQKFNFVPHKTCIFFDEIQECPRARTSLKDFALDKRYDVIASGSLLGIKYKSKHDAKTYLRAAVPVGFEDQCFMYPLDFEEFLWAKGIDEERMDLFKGLVNEVIKSPLKNQLTRSVNEMFEKLMLEYMVVGGMPEAVDAFVTTKDYIKVREIQTKIVSSYKDDIDFYASDKIKNKVSKVYNAIPTILGRDNKKFKFSYVDKKARSVLYEDALEWVYDSWLCTPCYNLSHLDTPLEGNYIFNYFKVYMNDSGLLSSLYEPTVIKSLLEGNLGSSKGAIYENLAANILIKKGYKLCYYQKDYDGVNKEKSGFEIEFVVYKNSKINLLEVKSTNGSCASLNKVLKMNRKCVGYKFKSGMPGKSDNFISLPFYFLYFIF